mmetsp:Transcript_140593/g.262271  ORF Transcript_140593/g.262271 Transcript_140593/m.262271 type:complete len:104 (+) Transcript_140593:70-381(+)
MPGDWQCPGCGNHNFARSTACRQCGLALQEAGATAGSATAQTTTTSTPEVETFLAMNQIADHAAEISQRLNPKYQQQVDWTGSACGDRNLPATQFAACATCPI